MLLSSHPPPPKAELTIAQLNPYWCITEPCYDNPIIRQAAASGYNAPGWLKSWISGGSSSGWRSKIQTQSPSISAPIFQPVLSPSPVPDRAYVQPESFEETAINPNRPVVTVTAAERDQFYADRASILARYPGYVAGAESDPFFIISDAPEFGAVSSPFEEKSPPPLLQDVGQTNTVAVTGVGSVTRLPKPSGGNSELGGQPMGWLDTAYAFGGSFLNAQQPSIYENIGLLGGATAATLPGVLGGIAGQYFGQSNIASPAPLPPYLNPTTATTSVPVASIRSTAVGCISQRDIDIAAAAGTSPEMVDLILKLGRRNRRRKRMLTKSDIGDISTMRQILGGGEAFKVWLAKATR